MHNTAKCVCNAKGKENTPQKALYGLFKSQNYCTPFILFFFYFIRVWHTPYVMVRILWKGRVLHNSSVRPALFWKIINATHFCSLLLVSALDLSWRCVCSEMCQPFSQSANMYLCAYIGKETDRTECELLHAVLINGKKKLRGCLRSYISTYAMSHMSLRFFQPVSWHIVCSYLEYLP